MTDNTNPPVPPIPPVPESGTPAPVEPQPQAPAGGEYTTAPATDPYSQPAAQPSAPPAYGAAPDANPYAQQPPAYGQPSAYGQQPGYPAQGAPYGYNAGYAVAPPKGLSIASLITGIGSIVTITLGIGFFAGIAAVILGFIAKKNQPYAKGMWLTGIITGFAAIGLSIIGLIVFVVFYAYMFDNYGTYNSY